MENLNLKIENFEGPFDLLLKLIKVNKMEITDIRISEITDQYISLIHEMDELNMEVASEFFVIAATLIEIKTKELLPKKKDEEEVIDTKEMLLHKLKEYEFFKKVSEKFGDIYKEEDVIVTRLPMTIEDDSPVPIKLPKDFGIEAFFLLYMELLDRQKEKTNTVTVIDKKIPIDSFKVEDMMVNIKDLIKNKKRMTFKSVVETSSCKAETIVLFLALLELVRNHSLKVYQEESLGELILEES